MRSLALLSAAALALFVSAPALAQSPAVSTSLAGVDVMTATVLQEGQSSFSGLALRLRLKSAELVDNVQIMPTIEYWRNSSSVSTFGIKSVRRDATMGVDGRWTFPMWQHFKPYAGAGFGAHFLSNKVDAPSLGLVDATDSVVKGGVSLLAGADWEMNGRLGNVFELKYHHVGGYRQMKINWGLSWAL
jgi:hypothetical protein